MQIDCLFAILQTTLHKTKVLKLTAIANEKGFSIHQLIDFTFHHDQQIGFRAAWILENIYTNYNVKFFPAITYFLDRFPEQHNSSARRHFAKILAFITDKKASPETKQVIADYDTDLIVETTFSWLIDEKVPVAIKSQCLSALANFNAKHNWIKEELLQTMDFLVDKESIGFYSKVKKVRKQLKSI